MSIKANVLTGLASGIRGYQTGIRSREEAQRLQEEQKRKLASQPDPALVKSQKELALEQQIATINSELDAAAGAAFNKAMRMSYQNKNPSAMTASLKNPRVQSMFPNVSRFMPINLDDPEDIRMLEVEMTEDELANAAASGVQQPNAGEGSVALGAPTPPRYDKNFWQNNPDVLQRYVKVIGRDGTADFMDLNVMKAKSGYKKYITDKEMEEELATLNLDKARREAKGLDKKPKPSLAVQMGNELTRVNEILDVDPNNQLALNQKAYLLDKLTGDPSEDQKEIRAVKEKKTKFYENYPGGREAFLKNKLVVGSPEEAEARDLAFDLMKLNKNFKFSDRQKEDITEIRRLTDLGDVAAGLTPNTTGLWDNFKSTIAGYLPMVSTDPKEKAARVAYETLFNVALNRDYGSQVTAGEMGRAKKAMGDLNLQLPEVFAGIKGQVSRLRSDLASLANFTDPLIAKVFLDMSRKDIDNLISRLDQSITMLTGIDPNIKVDKTETTSKGVEISSGMQSTLAKIAERKAKQ